jgi:regulator of protease activity HflC (stomatin/prohibitin superfamily)
MDPIIFVLIVLAIFVISLISKGLIVVRQAEVVIIERLGKYYKTLDSGLHLIVPIFDRPRPIHWRYTRSDYRGQVVVQQRSENRIDLRETVYDFPRQNVITSESISMPCSTFRLLILTRLFMRSETCRKPLKSLLKLLCVM